MTLRLTEIQPEALECNGGKGLQGFGPWWVCCITPRIKCTCRPSCSHYRDEGYFKAAAHSMELAMVLAVSRWDDFRRLTAPNVEQDTLNGAQKPSRDQ